MTVRHMTRAAIAATVIGLAACSANPPYNSTGSNTPSSGAVYYGHVESIETVPGTARSGPGIGAIVGGIAGNQVGQGRSNRRGRGR